MSNRFDAAIIGAGIAGLGIAWRAAELGMNVVLLDSSDPGHGATWVAAGMLAPVTEAGFGEDDLTRLSLEGLNRIPGFLDDLEHVSGHRVELSERGTLFVALDRDQLEALVRVYEFQISLGLESKHITAEECRAMEPALHPATQGGILAPFDRSIDPRDLVAALVAAAGATGVQIRRSRVESVSGEGVRLSTGEFVRADKVVVAAGAHSGAISGIPPKIAAALRPVKGQILRLRGRPGEPPPITTTVRTHDVYLVPRRNGEVVVGATVEDRGFDTSVTAGAVLELLRAADEVVPGIREMVLAETSAGLRPASHDGKPLLGSCSTPGLVFATGHYRNGVLLMAVTAEAIAHLLVKEDTPVEITPFAPGRFEETP